MNIKDALNEVQIKYLSAKLCCCILVLQLKLNNPKIILLSRSENSIMQRLTFCLILRRKKSKKGLPRPGFEPAISWLEALCGNHYTTAATYVRH